MVWDTISASLKKDYRPEDIQTVSVRESGNGSGDILFNAETDHGPMAKYRKHKDGLSDVDNVRQVESLLQELISKKKLF